MTKLNLLKKIISAAFIVFTSLFGTLYAADFGILPAGSAAVTGFSGTINAPDHSSLFNNEGPSVRIISLPRSYPYGLREAAKPFTVFNRDVGQVFGIALDNAIQPNIYVAATSAYGLAIYSPNQGRLKKGTNDAQFMPGQFGPGGGPNSIWRIDGTTGKVTLFANVVYQNINDAPASLGALAFDPITNQLFVSDRSTGMIHQFAMDGSEMGVYDHGVQGLGAAGLPAVAFDPATVANINMPEFDVENPETWGYAPKERRVFALAVYEQRLYYSVYGPQIWSVGITPDGSIANDARLELDSPALLPNTEISSIAFDQNGYLYIAERGAPTGDYQFINVAMSGQNRVKRFSPKIPDQFSPYYWRTPGQEYALGMNPDYQNSDGGVALTCGRDIWMTGDRLLDDGGLNSPHIDGLQGNDKVLVKPANMPPLQSWLVNYYDTEADPNSRGHMGAIVTRTICGGYGYGGGYGTISQPPPLGFIPPLCIPRIIFWFGCPCLYSDNTLASDEYNWLFYGNCHSCYGFPGSVDGLGFGGFWGFGGSFEGVGSFWNFGFDFEFGFGHGYGFGPGLGLTYGYDGYCSFETCFPSYITCYPYCFPYDLGYSCNSGMCSSSLGFPHFGMCGCPWLPADVWWPTFDFCNCPYFFDEPCAPPPSLCPPDYLYESGQCVPPPPPTVCPPSETYTNGECVPTTPPRRPPVTPPTCPPNTTYTNGTCVPTTPPRIPPTIPPRTCPQGQVYIDGQCACPTGYYLYQGQCTPNTVHCKKSQRFIHGRCITPTCPEGQVNINGYCITKPICAPGQTIINGRCAAPPFCGPHYRYINGKCVPICTSTQILINGQCITQPGTKPPHCGPNQRLVNNRCITAPFCGTHYRYVKGKCVPICTSTQILVNGRCVTKPGSTTPHCRSNQYWVNGKCITKPSSTCGTGQRLVHGRCVSIKPETTLCRQGQIFKNGHCVTITKTTGQSCPSGQLFRNGRCISVQKTHSCPSGQILRKGTCVPRTSPNTKSIYLNHPNTQVNIYHSSQGSRNSSSTQTKQKQHYQNQTTIYMQKNNQSGATNTQKKSTYQQPVD